MTREHDDVEDIDSEVEEASQRRVLLMMAKDVRKIRESVAGVRPTAAFWGFMGGMVPAIILLIYSIAKMALGGK